MELKDVENLANLARLELSTEEKTALLGDMQGILEYVKQIESVEVEDIQPEYAVHNVWREDILEIKEFSKDSIVEQFPDSQPARADGSSSGGNFLKVKKIL